MSEDFTDLTSVIEDSVNDAIGDIDDTPEVDSTPDAEASSEPSSESTEPEVESTDSQVPTPAMQAETTPEPAEQDSFEKLAGVPQMGITGRENRIPYSRVKKITEKAVGEVAEAALGRKLNPGEKAADVVKDFVAQIPQLQSRVKDYETRLDTVGQFENVMSNDPQRFLQMLAKLPAYSQFFTFVENAYNALQSGYYQKPGGATPGQPAVTPGQVPQQLPTSGDAMPEPDEALPDGSKVYSLEGLKKLLAWHATSVESKVSNQFEQRYKALESQYQPIRKDWEDYQRRQSVLPVIRQQIAEARNWTLFNENEEAITKALQADRNLTLEGAYRQVVFPKLVSERNTMRQDILKELQTAPTSTAVPGKSLKPTAPATGPRALEDIIKESIETLR